jgi:hypothetical protein
VFEGISKGMVDQMGAEITGRAVLLLVRMVALVEAEITGEAVLLLLLLLVGMAARVEAGITGEAVLLLVGMAALVEAEITGRAVNLVVVVVAFLVETTEVAEERLRQRETLRMLQSLDGRMLQQGRTEPLLPQVKDEVPTAMMVRLIRVVIVSFRLSTLCCVIVLIRALGLFFLASPRGDPRVWPNPRTSISTITKCPADGTTTCCSRWPQHISAAN